MDGTKIITNLTTFTAIYAPNLAIERKVFQSTEATIKEFPNDIRLAWIDEGTENLAGHLFRTGWKVARPLEGKPPRMREMLLNAVQYCETPYLWTIEHDVLVKPGVRDPALRIMTDNPRIAGLELWSLNNENRLCGPMCMKNYLDYPGNRDLMYVLPYLSLSCVLWRTDALQKIDWKIVPEFPGTDQIISWLLLRAGWDLLGSHSLACQHLAEHARNFLLNPQSRAQHFSVKQWETNHRNPAS